MEGWGGEGRRKDDLQDGTMDLVLVFGLSETLLRVILQDRLEDHPAGVFEPAKEPGPTIGRKLCVHALGKEIVTQSVTGQEFGLRDRRAKVLHVVLSGHKKSGDCVAHLSVNRRPTQQKHNKNEMIRCDVM